MIIYMGWDYGKAICQQHVSNRKRLASWKLDGATASANLDYHQLQLAQKCLIWRIAKIKVPA